MTSLSQGVNHRLYYVPGALHTQANRGDNYHKQTSSGGKVTQATEEKGRSEEVPQF